MSKLTCSFNGCENLQRSYGYCKKHANILKASHGLSRPTVEQRFWKNVSKGASCWDWLGTKNATGYGMFHMDGKTMNASRASYLLLIGNISDGLFVDHTCHNKACVNPDHLRTASRKQNGENLIGANCISMSGVRNVSWHKKAKKWVVTVMHDGKKYHGGLFESLDVAEIAATELRGKLFTHSDGR